MHGVEPPCTVEQAADKASPYVRSATDTVSPYVKTAIDTVRDVAGPALRQAQPQLQVSGDEGHMDTVAA